MSMDARDQFPVDMVEQMLKFTPSPEERVKAFCCCSQHGFNVIIITDIMTMIITVTMTMIITDIMTIIIKAGKSLLSLLSPWF